jgi:hypothetical protein
MFQVSHGGPKGYQANGDEIFITGLGIFFRKTKSRTTVLMANVAVQTVSFPYHLNGV